MARTTIEQFATELMLPPSALLEQLPKAGVAGKREGDDLSEQDKAKLLEYLQKQHAVAGKPERKITLTRKQTTEIKGLTGKARTIQVEVRKKRVFVKRDESETAPVIEGAPKFAAAAPAVPAQVDAYELELRAQEERRYQRLVEIQAAEMREKRRRERPEVWQGQSERGNLGDDQDIDRNLGSIAVATKPVEAGPPSFPHIDAHELDSRQQLERAGHEAEQGQTKRGAPKDDRYVGPDVDGDPVAFRVARAKPKHSVFISVNSRDLTHARRAYDFLQQHGVDAFLSDISLPRLGRTDFTAAISAALEECRHMLVVASSPEHMKSKWVMAEWGAFVNELNSGRKVGNLVTLLVADMGVGELPGLLRSYQSERLNEAGLERLLKFLVEDDE